MLDNHGQDEFGSPVHSRREPSSAVSDLSRYCAESGRLVPVWTLEIQTLPDDVDKILDAVLHVHHYEEPVIFLREDWASRAAYNPKSTNPNRWWNDGRGLPDKLQ
jgi:hypothetical protein